MSDAKLSPGAERLLAYLYGCEQAGRAPGAVEAVAAVMDPPMTELEVLRALCELAEAGMIEPGGSRVVN